MARCEDCLHYEICEIMDEQYGISKVYPIQCGFYTNTADVVPKSDVARDILSELKTAIDYINDYWWFDNFEKRILEKYTNQP